MLEKGGKGEDERRGARDVRNVLFFTSKKSQLLTQLAHFIAAARAGGSTAREMSELFA